MVAITLKSGDLKSLVRAVKRIKGSVPGVVKPVIAGTLQFGKQAVNKAIQAQYLIQTSDIHSEVKLNGNGLGGSVEVTGGMLRLTRFPHHPTASPRGVMPTPMFAQVKVGGGGVMRGGFMSATGQGIFIRSGGAARLPINRLLTIGAPIMASQPSVGPVAIKAVGDELDKRASAALKQVLASAGGK